MGAYIIRRLIAMVGMLIALSMIVFFLFDVLPADPARLTCGKACTPQIIEANRHKLGLRPAASYVQYGEFVKGIFVGRTYGEGKARSTATAPCLGYSFLRNEHVTDADQHTLPVTFELAIGGFIIWIVVGVSVGHLRRAQTREVAGPHHHGSGPGRLLASRRSSSACC